MLSVSADAKTRKGEKRRFLTGVLYLAPHTVSGRNVCPDSTPGCRQDCLFTAGRGAMRSVHRARVAKTQRLRQDPEGFFGELFGDIRRLSDRAIRLKMTPLVRLNGTSDIPWENTPAGPITSFPWIQFYDYTKSFRRMQRFLAGQMPSNYHLTFSRSECNDEESRQVLATGGNVAVVFDTKRGARLPQTWQGFKVIDGDRDDVRHKDSRPRRNQHGANGSASIASQGVVVGLRAKGRARSDSSGFVVQTGGNGG